MSTETESAQACLGWQCLVAKPENPEQAGWHDGYCPDCQDELARDEIREERQDARNEVERPTPLTAPLMHAAANESIDRMFLQGCDLERQLAEANKARDDYFAAWTTCLRKRGELKEKLAEAREENQRLTSDMILHERMSIQFMEQRDKLAEELRDIRDESPAATVPQWILERIDEALATIDQKESE